ncbi:MAG: hypothetical protein JJU10_11855 [Idiomarina sp.]|nr:hypothetical protein [Idiomarina sp.]
MGLAPFLLLVALPVGIIALLATYLFMHIRKAEAERQRDYLDSQKEDSEKKE